MRANITLSRKNSAMPSETLLFMGAAEVATCLGPPRASEGEDPAGILSATGVAVQDGRIAAVAPEADLVARYPQAEQVSCEGGLLTPGLVDSA